MCIFSDFSSHGMSLRVKIKGSKQLVPMGWGHNVQIIIIIIIITIIITIIIIILIIIIIILCKDG